MVDSRDKGYRAEIALRDLLRKNTKLGWERTPSSGALQAQHKLKGDLYIPGEKNMWTVEVKHYADPQISHLLISGKSKVEEWWNQALTESEINGNAPLLVFKHDRGKWYCAIPQTQWDIIFFNVAKPRHIMVSYTRNPVIFEFENIFASHARWVKDG